MLGARCLRLPQLLSSCPRQQLPPPHKVGNVRCASSGQSQILKDEGIKASVQQATAKANARALRIDTKGRHIFLCVATKAKCCAQEQQEATWQWLKARLKELGIDKHGPVFRSKVDCLRICGMGPIAVVQPDQVYYHSCTPEVLELIIQQHLINGKVVEEYRVRED